MMRAAGAALVAAWVVAATPVLGADYPYSGFLTGQSPTMSGGDAQLACALGFFRQDKDGTFVSYHLDRARFEAGGTLRYVEYMRGACSVDASGKVESCNMTAASDPAEIGKWYFDAILSITPAAIDIRSFETVAAVEAYLKAGGGITGAPVRFTVCNGFDDSKLAPFLSGTQSTLSFNDRMDLIAPVIDAGKAEAARRILKIIHGQ